MFNPTPARIGAPTGPAPQTVSADEIVSDSANLQQGPLYMYFSGFNVSKDLYHQTQKQVELRLKDLQRSVPYTAKELCGEPFWGLLSKGDRNKAGMSISNLAALGKLQLTLSGINSANAKIYQLK